MKHSCLAMMLIACSAVLAGCVANVDDEEDDVGTTSQAMTTLDVCATGTDANALGNIVADNVSDDYLYSYQWHDICAPDRMTTIVDFDVDPNVSSNLGFYVTPYFDTQTTSTQCLATKIAMRVQKPNGSGGWTDLNYQEKTGVWDHLTNTCTVPAYTEFGLTHPGGFSRYRVRAWAKNGDGSFATIYFRGANAGHWHST